MKLLFVNCCISQKGEKSRTLKLCSEYLDAFRQAHPDAEIITEDIRSRDIFSYEKDELDRREALERVGGFDDPLFDMARRFCDADRVLIGAPFWDMLFPTRLRAYIEHISVNGMCYYYDETGSHGKCKASELVYITSGGSFEQEQCAPAILWKQLCEMFGIEKFSYVFAGGLDITPEFEAEGMNKALEKSRMLGKH